MSTAFFLFYKILFPNRCPGIQKSPGLSIRISATFSSAVGGTWTRTHLHGHEPESCAYANSATTAYSILFFLMICIRKMQLTGLEPVRARLTRSLVLRVCQFRHNCIFCFCLLSNFVCCFFVFSVAHLTIYILSHWQWFVNTFFKKNQKTFCRCLFVSQN